MIEGHVFFGRRKIFTDNDVVNATNIVDVLDKAYDTHLQNSEEIQYLYDYYKGRHPVLERTKEYNDTILNKLVVNRANEIVDFKTGYLVGEPVQYVNRSGNVSVSEAINLLNEYMFAEDKSGRDKELVEWFHICGTAFRMAIPDSADGADAVDESPFEIYTLDPRNTFVVYHSGLGEKPKVAFRYVIRQDNRIVFSAYTDREYFEIVDGKITAQQRHTLGMIPIIEYPANNARLGAFEIVLSLLDGIDELLSDRLDAVEMFVQSLLVFKGVDIEDDDFAKLKYLGGIAVPADGDVKYVGVEMNQTSTQTLVDDVYQTILTICAMPSQAMGNQSDSSNNGAVILRNGWQAAEARAKDTELMFKQGEKQFLKLVLRIMDTMRDVPLKVSDIEIRFTRRNYEDIQAKAQVLCEMLGTDKIHPKLAFSACNLFSDSELAYTMSEEYWQSQQERILNSVMENSEDDEDANETSV